MTEEQRYTVVDTYPEFEVRRYDAHLVAEVVVEGAAEEAGNLAFRSLAGYIGGRNRARRSVTMTAPVVQSVGARRVQMTAPVVQRQDSRPGSHVVAFVMPASETFETLPEPEDPGVTLRAVPEECAAALRYSGRWTQSAYDEHVERLHQEMAKAGLSPAGPPRWARFNPPWTPWFLRRNEVIIPIARP